MIPRLGSLAAGAFRACRMEDAVMALAWQWLVLLMFAGGKIVPVWTSAVWLKPWARSYHGMLV